MNAAGRIHVSKSIEYGESIFVLENANTNINQRRFRLLRYGLVWFSKFVVLR